MGLLDKDKSVSDPDLSPSFFEFTTAIAFSYFKSKAVDLALLEVGMGGRLDATNVALPEFSVITGVALDHMSTLGTDLASIAKEKAGIIKKAKPVVVGRLDDEARAVIESISKERSAELIISGSDFSVDLGKEAGDSFNYRSGNVSYDLLELSLFGDHQKENAGVAIAALAELSSGNFNITEVNIREGLKSVEWPGRFEIVGREPTVILDCAHNNSAAMALAESLREFNSDRIIFVLSIMKDKEVGLMLAHLAPLAETIIFTRADIDRAEDPELLLKRLRELPNCSVKAKTADSVGAAIKMALGEAQKGDLVCIAGSAFIVGEAKGFL
jgi:dihydrofolate synthase/folylpolyglutamate synthase